MTTKLESAFFDNYHKFTMDIIREKLGTKLIERAEAHLADTDNDFDVDDIYDFCTPDRDDDEPLYDRWNPDIEESLKGPQI